jgi:hypothetical protein
MKSLYLAVALVVVVLAVGVKASQSAKATLERSPLGTLKTGQ